MNSKRKGIANTSLPNVGGPITTSSGLMFIGATRGRRFRAFDAKSGKELLSPGRCSAATPATYQVKDGKEYAVMASGRPSDDGPRNRV